MLTRSEFFKKIIDFYLKKLKYICVIDQACSFKMVAFGLFYVFIDWDEVGVNKNAKTNDLEWGQYTAILNAQAWSTKNLLYGK